MKSSCQYRCHCGEPQAEFACTCPACWATMPPWIVSVLQDDHYGPAGEGLDMPMIRRAHDALVAHCLARTARPQLQLAI